MSAGFGAALLRWFDGAQRDLPWRRRRDPYTTWVSEVMLQQTTVDVVAPRYEAFLERFPDLASLAGAREDEVVAAWSGLGYYRRARGLHRGAREVVARHGGRIPDEVAALRELPGVGAYTAGAIASLGFGRRAAAVDGNVARVMARVLDDHDDVGTVATRRRFEAAVLERMPDRAAAYTEALIELGALVCRPRDAGCDRCPVSVHCAARAAGTVDALPVKKVATPSIPVLSLRAVVERGDRLLLVRRPDDASLLPGFLELPGRWCPAPEDPAEVLPASLTALGLRAGAVGAVIGEARHSITHHRIRAVAHRVAAAGTPSRDGLATFITRATLDSRELTTETRKLLIAALETRA